MNFARISLFIAFAVAASVCVARAHSASLAANSDRELTVYQSTVDNCKLTVRHHGDTVLYKMAPASSVIFVTSWPDSAGDKYVSFTSPYRDESLTVSFETDGAGNLRPVKAVHRDLAAEKRGKPFSANECRGLVRAG